MQLCETAGSHRRISDTIAMVELPTFTAHESHNLPSYSSLWRDTPRHVQAVAIRPSNIVDIRCLETRSPMIAKIHQEESQGIARASSFNAEPVTQQHPILPPYAREFVIANIPGRMPIRPSAPHPESSSTQSHAVATKFTVSLLYGWHRMDSG